MLYLAIDQHSKQLTVNLRNEAGDVLIRRQVSTRGEATQAFLREVQELATSDGGYVAIVEVCGFNDWLLRLLPASGCREIVLVQADRRVPLLLSSAELGQVSRFGAAATSARRVQFDAAADRREWFGGLRIDGGFFAEFGRQWVNERQL